MSGRTFSLLLVLGLASTSVGHICLLSPRQRGELDISTAGNPTCFRHGAPCGGPAPEHPRTVYWPGSTAFITWQQNYNHYEPGFPGYMDIAIASSPDSTNFKVLAVVTDRYEHAQHHQRNYTAAVKMPMMICNSCVLRVRYNAHKPGETTFYQCADIEIEPKPPGLSYKPIPPAFKEDNNIRKALSLKSSLDLFPEEKELLLYGFAYNPFQPGKSGYVSVNMTTGMIQKLNELDFGIDSFSTKVKYLGKDNAMVKSRGPSFGDDRRFMLDEIVAIDYFRNTSTILVHDEGTRDDPAKLLYTIGTTNGSLVEYSELFAFDGSAINAMTWYTDKTYLTFSIEPVEEKPGAYNFVLGMIADNSYRKVAQADKPEGLYVNFQWLEKDISTRKVYALMGNENAADALNARIYTFDPYNSRYIGMAELDVSQFTFMSVQSFPGSDLLYAFSPGLTSDAVVTWSLVTVDPLKGTVTKRCDIGPPGVFERYYGGSIFAGSYNEYMKLYHVMRVANSDADVIVTVDPRSCAVAYSEMTNLRHVHNLSRPCTLENPNNCFVPSK